MNIKSIGISLTLGVISILGVATPGHSMDFDQLMSQQSMSGGCLLCTGDDNRSVGPSYCIDVSTCGTLHRNPNTGVHDVFIPNQY